MKWIFRISLVLTIGMNPSLTSCDRDSEPANEASEVDPVMKDLNAICALADEIMTDDTIEADQKLENFRHRSVSQAESESVRDLLGIYRALPPDEKEKWLLEGFRDLSPGWKCPAIGELVEVGKYACDKIGVLKIELTPSEMKVGGEIVITMEDGTVDPIHKAGNPDIMLVFPLREKLEAIREYMKLVAVKRRQEFVPALCIQVDDSVHMRLLAEVLFTASRSGWSSFHIGPWGARETAALRKIEVPVYSSRPKETLPRQIIVTKDGFFILEGSPLWVEEEEKYEAEEEEEEGNARSDSQPESEPTVSVPTIPCRGGNDLTTSLDFRGLYNGLAQLKKQKELSTIDSIQIITAADIPFSVLFLTMETVRCRLEEDNYDNDEAYLRARPKPLEDCAEPLFPAVTLLLLL